MMMTRSILVAATLVAMALTSAGGAWAQEPPDAPDGTATVVDETFDGTTLDGWEVPPTVEVGNGTLTLGGGEFAFVLGEWSQLTATLDLSYAGPGVLTVQYAGRDDGHYALRVLDDGALILDRVQRDAVTPLAVEEQVPVQSGTTMALSITWQDGQHTVGVNGTDVLSATDPEPLLPGAFGLIVDGDRTVTLERVRLAGTTAAAHGGLDGDPEPGLEPGPGGEPGPGSGEEPGGAPGLDADVTTGSAASGSGADANSTEATSSDGGLQAVFEDLLSLQSSNVDTGRFVVNLVLAAMFSFVLSRVYIHWGTALSNRRRFASSFMLVAVTTTFIILVVRSSVALSLGLVGALSIIRFRAAIKDPEELAYMFLAVGIGIGLGDDQRLVTILSLGVAVAIIGLLRLFRRAGADVNLHVTIASDSPGALDLPTVTRTLEPHCAALQLSRWDETPRAAEAAFLAEFRTVEDLHAARGALQELPGELSVSFLDHQGLL